MSGPWEEAGVPRRNPLGYWEKSKLLHRETPEASRSEPRSGAVDSLCREHFSLRHHSLTAGYYKPHVPVLIFVHFFMEANSLSLLIVCSNALWSSKVRTHYIHPLARCCVAKKTRRYDLVLSCTMFPSAVRPLHSTRLLVAACHSLRRSKLTRIHNSITDTDTHGEFD